jgi:K+-sensing histidine kinase KdpD
MAGVDMASSIDRHRSSLITGAAIAPLIAAAVLAAFRDTVTATTSALVLVLVVVAAATTGVRIAGIVAALSSGVCFDFFLTKPYGRLSIADHDDIETTILLVLIGAAVTEVALWGRRQQAGASRRAGYLDGVLGTAEIVTLQHETPEALVDHVAQQIKEILEIARCRFVSGPVLDPQTPILDHQGLVTRREHLVNVDRDGLPTDDETALLVRRGGVTLGHFLLTAAADIAHPSREQRKVAVLLAAQVGAVLGTRTD